MNLGRYACAAAGLALACGTMAPAMAAEAGLSAYQGAWLEQSLPCEGVYSQGGKGASFKKPINIFAPAFIISGSRLRTPQATCRIRSVKPAGDRQILSLDCANAVAANAVTVQMAPVPDGTLKRFFNNDDKTGSSYRRCSR